MGATLQDNDEKDSGPAKTHLRPAQRDVLATPTRVLHPALLALQPVLGLYANNAGKTSLPELIRPAFVLAGGGVAVWLVLRVLLRDKYRAGVAASIVIVASLAGWNFLEYFIGSVEPVAPAGPWLAFNVVYGVACVIFLLAYRRMFASQPGVLLSLALLAAFAAVLIGLANVFLRGAFGAFPTGSIVAYVTTVVFCLAVVARYSGDFVNWTQTLNWFAGVLLALYMLLAAGNVWRLPPEAKSPASPAKATASLPAEVTAKYPDIYFVALEGYARPDVLQRSYACDITPFLTAMQGKGFQTVPDSRSNYALALFSLTSCLNMDYLQDVLGERKNGPNPFAEVFNAYHHNKVYDFLKSKGYSLHVLAPGSEPLDPRSNIDVTYKPLRSLTEFERVLAKSTAAGRAVQFVRYLRDDKPSTRRAAFIRERTEFVFDRLAGSGGVPKHEAGADCRRHPKARQTPFECPAGFRKWPLV
ncbi:MAG: hypothetical protein HZB26_14265 [Candidatus Hydrogenedentes bacterium]|nr:hypothetical protein [Candidatus Hydrogenedentota bacterium]